MGGLIAAYTVARNSDVQGLVMIAAWNLGDRVSRPSPEGLDTFKNASPRLAGSTPEGLYDEAKAHGQQWNYVTYAEQLKSRPVLILEAKDANTADNRAMAEALRKAGDTQVAEKYMETNHVFSDHRIALQEAVLEWLGSLSAPTPK